MPGEQGGPARTRAAELALVEDFLCAEAHLLDERRYDDWFQLLAPEIRYVMPSRSTRLRRPIASRAGWPVEEEMAQDGLQIFDETIHTLRVRIERLYTGKAWAEDPPSRTRRIVSNVRVTQASPERIHASSNFLLFQSRVDGGPDMLYAGRRDDQLLREGDDLRIASRFIVLDNVMLTSGNLSIFF